MGTLGDEKERRFEEIKTFLAGAFIAFTILGFIFGSIESFTSGEKGLKGCTYESIGGLINVGRVMGCELFRKRFEIVP